MDAAEVRHLRHPHADTDGDDDDDFLTASLRDDVFMVGKKPSTPAEIAVARSRLARRLASLSTASKHTARNASKAAAPTATPVEQLDVLARSTASFRVLLQRCSDGLEACRRSHYYSVLSRTTQPAHIVTFVSMALLAMLLFPRQQAADASASRTASTSANDHRGSSPAGPAGPSPWVHLTYVVAFAAHFGSQFWMTFVSGLSLFFSLPRHHFAEVQKVLFPLYFAINATLSLTTLATFLRLQSAHGGPLSTATWSWDAEVVVQVCSMVLCFLLELLVRLYLTPPLLQLITAKTEMEKTVDGVGQEVGRYDLGPLTQCPHYVRIHLAFRKVHAAIAVANIAAMGCTALHAHYLAGKICV
ncbi:hypothetical protein ONE63_000696 [Megalurothrips usitatus]|uniref:TMEM205-like domain-containing protein n=1 Tax=Megalurothrips usitatus TaxID=439358 RepID=A0AAV7Y599_9NEOP|nr:hypothetical protein ONE63_000696 [Megalurothrips usitatus]